MLSRTPGYWDCLEIRFAEKREKMRTTVSKSISIGLGLAFGLFGQIASTTTVPFQITSYVGSYTDPYGGTVNGVPNVPIICDDYADHVSDGESWTALVNDLSLFNQSGGQTTSNTVSTVYYQGGETAGYTQAQEYIAAADLAYQIYELGSPFGNPATNEPQRDDLSAAIWYLFQPTQVPVGNSYGQLDANAASLLAAALATTTGSSPTYASGAAFEAANDVDVTIYTPTANDTTPNTNTYNNGGGAPQEFITVTQLPEPATWAVLGFDFVGAGLVGLYFRRRRVRS
jgi:hypothetical protein